MASRKNIDDWETFNGSGKVYQDTSFGATYESLLWTNFLVDLSMLESYRTVKKWARPKDLVKTGRPTFWGTKGILPDGVVQGSLGDCWFLAAAASLAEKPDRIRKLFTNDGYSEEGIY